jgi:hypothetical protein
MVSPEGIVPGRDRSQGVAATWLASRSSHVREVRRRGVVFFLIAAMADSLRTEPERRLVSLAFASWNRIREWLRRLDALRCVA